MEEIKDNKLMEDILSHAKSVSEGIEEISVLSDKAGSLAGKYAEKIAVTAASLRNNTCAHMRELVEDMEKAVKIKL